MIAFSAPLFSLAAETSTEQYFRGLRERRLFRLAESYCQQQLQRPRITSAQRAELTLQLAQTYAEHATYAAEPDQAELWGKARQTLDEFLELEPQHPRRFLFEVQQALISAEAGRSLRWQAELSPEEPDYASEARRHLQAAAAGFRSIEPQVSDQAKRMAGKRTVRPEELRSFELRGLAVRAKYHLAATLLDLAELLPVESPDRAAALLEAGPLLKSLAESPDDDGMTWDSRLFLARSRRQSGDPAQAIRTLDTLEKQAPPTEFADRILAERVRCFLARRKLQESQVLLGDAESAGTKLTGELLFLRLQVQAELWKASLIANSAQSVVKTPGEIEETLRRLQSEDDGYWTRRADLVVNQIQDVQKYGVDLAPLVRQAQARFQRGKLNDAIEAYGRAAATAHRQGKGDLAFDFAFTRGSIEIQSKQWPDAAVDFLELAEQFPANARAADAHLLAAYALGKQFERKPTKSNREEYTATLERHRETFAGKPTAAEATWMLAELNERREQLTAAYKLYRDVPETHSRGPSARIAVARCHEKILGRLRELKEDVAEWESVAIREVEGMLPGAVDSKSVLDDARCEIAVRFARILLRKQPADFARGEMWLSRVFAALDSRGAEGDDKALAEYRMSLRTQAAQLRIISLAGQRKFQEAKDVLNRLSAVRPGELLRILEGISPLRSDDREDPLRDLGELQLQAALKLDEHRTDLSPADQRRLDECLARGYAATGQTRKGLDLYEKLLGTAPRDKALLTAYAELLMSCRTRDCLQKAVTAWRKLESLNVAGSTDWLAVRYQVCRCLLELKDSVEACKLLKVTRLLYPELGGEKLKGKFGELEQACTAK